MPRVAEGIESDERDCAQAIRDILESIEDCCYFADGDGLSQETLSALHKTFRSLKAVALFYYTEDDLGLVWEPPTHRFKAKERNEKA